MNGSRPVKKCCSDLLSIRKVGIKFVERIDTWFARKAANRVVMMDEGLIIEEGTPEHFFEAPRQTRTRQFLSKIL